MMKVGLALIAVLLVVGCRTTGEHPGGEGGREKAAGAGRRIIAPTKTIGPYSPAVQVGNVLFVSGQIGLDPQSGALKNETIENETQQALANLATILHAAGFEVSQVVSATVYLKNMNDFGRMNEVYGKFFPAGNYPARTTVAVAELPKQANIEIAVIACKPE